ncbi:fibrobacter succinogenes major paralogous domain-containing protein [bacterium]|nr:fibrobacter succinogenes major paralogous domain-containing protein [bacterium]
MKRHLYIFIFLIQAQILLSQAPVVSNVSFQQRTDGSLLVDIYYDLSDTDGETKKIKVEASDDNGSTWTLTCTSLTGDVGTGVALGTNKHVVWDFNADNPNVSGSSYKVRVTASEVGTMTGNDGTTYKTVKIGNQWWMAENLKETQYRNSDVIPNVTDNTAWSGLSTGARCAYNNNESTAITYGYLYNLYAVFDSRYLAPAGWHVPTNDEWTTLVNYLGGTSAAGGKMKETGTTHWNSPNTGATNESYFSALPGGSRNGYSGSFELIGGYAFLWSSSVEVLYRQLRYSSAGISWGGGVGFELFGYSVRLVKD